MLLPPSLTPDSALFLDFDGTLAPLVDHPEKAGMAPATKNAVRRLHLGLEGAVALVSGRSLASLGPKVAPLQLAMAGGHGAERQGPKGEALASLLKVKPEQAQAYLDEIQPRLEAFVAEKEGLLLEPKQRGLALHYRARPELKPTCQEILATVLKDTGQEGLWRLISGHMVFELALIGADKGSAVAAFLAVPPFQGRLPIAIGDDATDEDMFQAVQAGGGFGVKIGPGETIAQHRFDTIEGFLPWLEAQAEKLGPPD